jgi:hypothetical protein
MFSNGGADDEGTASIGITGSTLGTPLDNLLMAPEIQPGSAPSYQLCKTIYLYHPLGAKMVEVPLNIAQSQRRDISIQNGPEDKIREAFEAEWEKMGADKHIYNVMRISRIYGIGAVVYGAVGVPTDRPLDLKKLGDLQLYFNVVDPLNTAGSLVLNQNPNSPDFQKHTSVSVAGQAYHRSRACVMLNEEPIYIEYTTSAFGFVGRSVYQRALFPLKSFVQSMITDDLVTKKAGLLVAMIKQLGSISDKVMQQLMGIKRNFLKQAVTGNVISVGHEDRVEAIDMTNTATGMTTARKNILDNIASSASMPAQLINNETMAEGFGEGTEDAKNIARYIDGIRKQMQPLYEFFDELVMYRAWSPDFYKAIQTEFPEYANIPYVKAFYDWRNSFKAEWPSLLIEPESEQIKTDEIRMKSLVSVVQVLAPQVDPDNKGRVFQWFQDNLNSNKVLFKIALDLDIEALAQYEPPAPPGGEGSPSDQEGGQGKPIEQLTRSDAADNTWDAPGIELSNAGNGRTMPAPRLPPDVSDRGVRPGVKRLSFNTWK